MIDSHLGFLISNTVKIKGTSGQMVIVAAQNAGGYGMCKYFCHQSLSSVKTVLLWHYFLFWSVLYTIANKQKTEAKGKKFMGCFRPSSGRFGPGPWAALVHGPFWSFPLHKYRCRCRCNHWTEMTKLFPCSHIAK